MFDHPPDPVGEQTRRSVVDGANNIVHLRDDPESINLLANMAGKKLHKASWPICQITGVLLTVFMGIPKSKDDKARGQIRVTSELQGDCLDD
ncbi:hypothetical protein VM1G_08957 [Cytospora mali]|uniref:Uncharacterized protein n=1 Tax=Cytospora mali TaxID=578113 RepID=A0A194WBE4_CYTMA|nr:hypothetical protein VM1G_08957 [Valsa mali]